MISEKDICWKTPIEVLFKTEKSLFSYMRQIVLYLTSEIVGLYTVSMKANLR